MLTILNPEKRHLFSTSINLIQKTLNAQPIIIADDADKIFKASIHVGSSEENTFASHLDSHSSEAVIVIASNREEIHKVCIERKVKLLITTSGCVINKELRDLAEKNKVSVITSPYSAIARCGGNLFVWLVFAAVMLWAIRLTANWAYTFTNLEHQDWRYTMLKEKTGRLYPLVNFLGIHLFPTLVVYLCIIPAVITIQNGVEFNLLCIPFIAMSFIAPIFQGIADVQMHIFRKSGAGGFIRTGLWKKSRHPNYVCEILMWWGIDLACFFVMSYNWIFLIGALVNTLMFLFISIPMADKHQSRKPGFEEYKKSTRML